MLTWCVCHLNKLVERRMNLRKKDASESVKICMVISGC